jgi:hypothetical protein
MNLIESTLLPKAHAQFLNGGSDWKISDFNFLKIFQSNNGEQSFNNVFGQIISLVLTIAAVVAFVYLLMAGFQYITAGGDSAKAQTARTGIINALIGIIIIIVSYTILRFAGGILKAPQ